MKTADARRYRGYRDDRVLDTRSLGVALRKLRAFQREGAFDELDVEGTIDATARNAGELEIILRPPRKPTTRVLLLMDVGGSMTPHAHLVNRLFSAARKATHFRELRTYYFHNCVYGRVYRTEGFGEPLSVSELLAECGPHWKLVLVGDALMAPYELLMRAGSHGRYSQDGVEGVVWMMQLAQHFERSAWLNPEPPSKLVVPHHPDIEKRLLHVPAHRRGAGRGGGAPHQGRRAEGPGARPLRRPHTSVERPSTPRGGATSGAVSRLFVHHDRRALASG